MGRAGNSNFEGEEPPLYNIPNSKLVAISTVVALSPRSLMNINLVPVSGTRSYYEAERRPEREHEAWI